MEGRSKLKSEAVKGDSLQMVKKVNVVTAHLSPVLALWGEGKGGRVINKGYFCHYLKPTILVTTNLIVTVNNLKIINGFLIFAI